MMRILFFSMLVMSGVVHGCTELQFEDVSDDPKYKRILGSRYEIGGPVDAYGIRRHSKAAVEKITLIPRPGIEGSEVGFRVPIEVGSVVTVIGVQRSNTWPDPNMSFLVQIDGTKLPVGVPIRIELFRGNEGQGMVKLNPSIYRQLPK